MFGPRIDYLLLRPFCHSRNRATEEQLDRDWAAMPFTRDDAMAYYKKVNGYFDGRLPAEPGLSYLDIGCGWGRLSFGLLEAGASDVTAIDIVPRNIEATRTIAARLGWADKLVTACADVHDWQPPRRFDVAIVLGALEHIHDPRDFLVRLAGLLKDGGRAFTSFEPFHSPIGDHLHGFFRVPIPWRGVLFSEQALLRLRREFFRPSDPVERFPDVVGGLNQMRYRHFLRYLDEAGLEIEYVNFTPQLRRYPPLHWASQVLCRIPRVRDYFAMIVFLVLKRKGSSR